MVFGWLFGEKKRQESEGAGGDVAALVAQAEAATDGQAHERAEALCREALALAPDSADAWTVLGVSLIRRDPANPPVRVQAVLAWMRALALRPGDSRAGDHLQAELQFAEDLIPGLVEQLSAPLPAADDAAAALLQIGLRARPALEREAQAGGPGAERARALLGRLA